MTESVFVNKCFSSDYTEARQAFLTAGRFAGAEVDSFQNPGTGQGDVRLFTDVALLGSLQAENILVLISGTHGVEGFCGSGIQVGLLREGIAGRLGSNTSLLMIHALNPDGFANLRRCNEDNVDLNRNFVDHSGIYPENNDYADLAEFLAPRSFSTTANFFATLRILWFRLRQGRPRLQQAVTQGQYSHPQGLFYGGRFDSWSKRILHKITERYLARARRVVVIDFHTGLGPYGSGEVILNGPATDPAYRRSVAWWGQERVKSTVNRNSVSAHLSGTVDLAFYELLPDAEVTAVGLEFGTLPPMEVFKALRAENWLHHHGRADHPAAKNIKQQFLRAFYPDDESWKGRVWEQGRLVVEQALASLNHR